MKRENLERANEIEKELKSLEDDLELMGYSSVNTVINYYNNSEIVKLIPDEIYRYVCKPIIPNKNTELGRITSHYIDAVKHYYETEIKRLTKEMEDL